MNSYSTLNIDIPPKRVFGWLGNDYDPSWMDSVPDRTDQPLPKGDYMLCHPKNFKKFYDEAKRGIVEDELGDETWISESTSAPGSLEDIIRYAKYDV